MQKTIFVVVGLVISDVGKILMTKRNEPELSGAHHKWELPGGKVAFGESAEEALKREIYEETGYRVAVNTLLPRSHMSIWRYDDVEQHTVVFCYRCTPIENSHKNTHDHHISDVQWVNKNDVLNLDALPGVKEFINMSI